MRYVLVASLLAFSCGGKKVERVSESAVTDVSDKWNDTDSRLVANEMVKDCLSRPWLERAAKKKKGKPVVIVQTIRNKTSEHIATGTFTKDLERELINDDRVEFVASKSQRDELREEKLDQANNATDDTMKGPGKEVGADFALQGSIESINQREGGTGVKFYQVNMELINLEDHKKVWIGDKKIKKVINQASTGW